MTLHEKIRQFTDVPVAEPFVKFLRAVIKRRNAEKNIWALAKNPFLGEAHDLRPQSASAPVRMYGKDLNVAIEQAGEVQDENSDALLVNRRNVNFAGRIGQPLKCLFRCKTKRKPRVRRSHESGAEAGFCYVLQRPDDEIIHCFRKVKIMKGGNNFEL